MKDLVPAWVNGELKPVNKLEVHKRALKHKAISVFIVSGTETLIQQRALTKYHTPGLWTNACCTHPYWEELPENCAGFVYEITNIVNGRKYIGKKLSISFVV